MHFSGNTFMAPYLHQFSAVVQKCIFMCYLGKFSNIVETIDAVTAPPKGAIWDEVNEQHQHKKCSKSNAQFALLWCNYKSAALMHILYSVKDKIRKCKSYKNRLIGSLQVDFLFLLRAKFSITQFLTDEWWY